MDNCKGDRAHWNKELKLSFNYRFWRNYVGFLPRQAFNPGIIYRLIRDEPEVVLFGGVWDSMTNIIGIPLLRNSMKVGWYEANDLIPGRISGLAGSMKRFLLRQLDWQAIPGQRAKNFQTKLLGAAAERLRISYLPNLVDESRFSDLQLDWGELSELREELGIPPDKKILFTPARLIPKKGLPQFLAALSAYFPENWHYLILGDGPELENVTQCIVSGGLIEQVSIKGFIDYAQMPKVYQLADVFCLPSMDDPNPLSVVEAMHSGKPVLLSNRLGNFPEAMQEGENGFSFTPGDKDSTVCALKSILELTDAQRSRMGACAKRIAVERWESKRAVEAFLQPILALAK